MTAFTRLLVRAAALAVTPALVSAQGVSPAPVSQKEFTDRLTRSIDSLAALDQFSGVVTLAVKDHLVFQRGYGMADREARRPNTVETAFNLGSINKIFTATAVRQLIAGGRLSPDSTLAAYWPDYPNAEVARRITIRQLMQHTTSALG